MNIPDEAAWVFTKSPHTDQPKTSHVFPVRDTDRTLCLPDGEIEAVLDYRRNDKLRVGTTYCIKAEHGDPLLGHVLVTGIDYWPLLKFNGHEQRLAAWRCGYDSLGELIVIWAYRHDHDFYKEKMMMDMDDDDKAPHVWNALLTRPPELYQAWLINFEPIKVE